MSKFMNAWGLLALIAGLAAGCSQPSSEPSSQASATGAADAAEAPENAYLLTEKPADAQGVAAARKSDAGEGEVAVEGLIGGSEEPFVEGVAAFTIVDLAIPPCSADEGCPTPWDYCCNTDQLKDNSALVKIVGADGKPVSKDARELLGVKELSKVVVRGKAKQDEQGNLTVMADKVYVAKD
ncbi:MAG TPA: hypothetical protein VHC19_22835 [Pirellulales bacterium]|nr:hypothetical protein [Pirellulales bacterium]